ncbi:hypothetical protein [Magnetofaba australis]|nr:hypothetical protein [Magnetofaba australis]
MISLAEWGMTVLITAAAIASPGPNFVAVSQRALHAGRAPPWPWDWAWR